MREGIPEDQCGVSEERSGRGAEEAGVEELMASLIDNGTLRTHT